MQFKCFLQLVCKFKVILTHKYMYLFMFNVCLSDETHTPDSEGNLL